jgi:hypothetical protein
VTLLVGSAAILIGRWLLTQPRILILDEPTRGIDVGAKAETHGLICRLAGEGLAVLMPEGLDTLTAIRFKGSGADYRGILWPLQLQVRANSGVENYPG